MAAKMHKISAGFLFIFLRRTGGSVITRFNCRKQGTVNTYQVHTFPGVWCTYGTGHGNGHTTGCPFVNVLPIPARLFPTCHWAGPGASIRR